MILFLRVLFLGLFLAIAASVLWASLDTPLWAIPREVTGHPWFLTTLVDIYVSFITFYVWVAYRERGWPARGLWFVAIMGLGSMAVTFYCIVRLFAASPAEPVAKVLLREEHWRKVFNGG